MSDLILSFEPLDDFETLAKGQYDKWKWVAKILEAKGLALDPFVAKCLYVMGTARHIMYAANKLLENGDHSLPAFLLGCTVAELLGRCELGDTQFKTGARKRLKAGLDAIFKVEGVTKVKTSGHTYTIDTLLDLRNFGAHGSAGSDQDLIIDQELVCWFWGAIGNTLNDYFEVLSVAANKNRREKMAIAAIYPIFFNGYPTRIQPTYKHLRMGLRLNEPSQSKWNWSEQYKAAKQANSR